MNHIKYKLIIFLATFLGAVGYVSLIQTPKVFASSLNYGITCKDGSKKLDVETNRSRHEVTVKCKSGAKFTYELGDNGQNLVKLSCPAQEKPVPEVGNGSTRLVTYCAIISGTPDHLQTTRTDSNPAVETSLNSNYDPDGGNPEEPPTFEGDCKEAEVKDLTSDNCAVIGVIKVITNTLAALAGVVIVAMIIWGGIQYSMAGVDASKVQAAKQKITSALIALLLLIFGFSIIQWLVPGGLL